MKFEIGDVVEFDISIPSRGHTDTRSYVAQYGIGPFRIVGFDHYYPDRPLITHLDGSDLDEGRSRAGFFSWRFKEVEFFRAVREAAEETCQGSK